MCKAVPLVSLITKHFMSTFIFYTSLEAGWEKNESPCGQWHHCRSRPPSLFIHNTRTHHLLFVHPSPHSAMQRFGASHHNVTLRIWLSIFNPADVICTAISRLRCSDEPLPLVGSWQKAPDSASFTISLLPLLRAGCHFYCEACQNTGAAFHTSALFACFFSGAAECSAVQPEQTKLPRIGLLSCYMRIWSFETALTSWCFLASKSHIIPMYVLY